MGGILNPLALYIHWPFCLSKCPYCDFNSHVRGQIDEQAWKEGLIHELKRYANLLQSWKQSYQLRSIFFGGGTPSLMKPQTVECLIQEAKILWSTDKDLEITLEANPNSVEVESFQGLTQAGVNRLSIGIQALNDVDLKKLGRQHSAQEGLRAIEIACSIFKRVSFDLIYDRPDQTVKQWEKELAHALMFDTEHLSLYQLTIESGTAFATQYDRGELILPSQNISADLYELTYAFMDQNGRPSYEVSNYAKKGAECRHNLAYWRYQDYLGIGPGAHGRLTPEKGVKISTCQKRSPEKWLQSIADQGHGDAEFSAIDLKDQFREQLLMGLRLHQGIELENLVIPLDQGLKDKIIDEKRLNLLEKEQFLEINPTHFKATRAGQQRLQSILNYLL